MIKSIHQVTSSGDVIRYRHLHPSKEYKAGRLYLCSSWYLYIDFWSSKIRVFLKIVQKSVPLRCSSFGWREISLTWGEGMGRR